MENNPVRVGHIVGKMVGGGVESMLLNYYRHIDRDNIQFDFIIDEDSTIIPYDEIESLGGKVYIIPSYEKIIEYHTELYRLLKKNQYQIVHSHINSLSVFPLRIAKKANVKIRIAHSHSTSSVGERKKNIIKNILRPYSRIYPTDFMACSDSASQWLFGKKSKSCQLIINGIDTQKYRYNSADRKAVRDELGLTTEFVIGHTGRLSYQKNQHFLINILPYILKKRPNTILMLLGEGDARESLEELASELNVRQAVLFCGNRRDVHRFYSAMDIFVFPSKYEGFGISSIEAQVAGLPVIQSKQVPKETKISHQCAFIDLEEGYKDWSYEILLTEINNRENLDHLFDKVEIKNNVKVLENFYLEKLKGQLI